MLVDDYSQYGVGVIYFLAAILAPLPFGYGTFVLALGVLTAVMLRGRSTPCCAWPRARSRSPPWARSSR